MGLLEKIVSQYKMDILTSLLKLVGSLSILGNPVGFVSTVCDGLSDLQNDTEMGFESGAIEGGIGVVTGVSKVLKSTLAGACNTVDKISSSIGGGLAALSQDAAFQQTRGR